MNKTVRLLVVLLLALAGAAVAVPASAGTTTGTTTTAGTTTAGHCAGSWGSLEKSVPLMGGANLQSVRAGRHDCFDRVVFEVDGPARGYWVGYVDQVTQDGSGAVIPVPGGARLQVRLHHASYDDAGNATYPRRVGQHVADVRGYSTLRSVVYGGSFEGDSTIGVGVRARLPFRVFLLDGPGGHGRIVLDVAHRWS